MCIRDRCSPWSTGTASTAAGTAGSPRTWRGAATRCTCTTCAATAARAAVAAQVVHVHRVAAPRHVLGEPAVPAAVLAVPVDHGEHGGRRAFGAPRLARQQETVGGRELRGSVLHGPA